MKIVIDARMYGPRHGGLGRYVQQLVQRLSVLAPQHQWVFLMGEQAAADYRSDTPRQPDAVRIVTAPWRWYSVAEQRHLPGLVRSLNPDLTHYPHFNVPLIAPQPFVVTVHDLIINHFPTSRATTLPRPLYALKLAAYRLVVRRVLRRARRIITPTDFVARDIRSSYPSVDSRKLVVIPEGLTEFIDSNRDDATVLHRYRIQTPYLLYVGSAYPHKDVIVAIAAFAILRRRGLAQQLIHVWRDDAFRQRLERQAQRDGLAEGVVWPGYVPDADLAALYRHAAAYVFPSRYEGFGLPPLEAQQYGCPVIAARASCLPEVLGSSAMWFEPGNAEELAAAVQKVLENQALRQELQAAGRTNVRRFDWQSMVTQILQTYEH